MSNFSTAVHQARRAGHVNTISSSESSWLQFPSLALSSAASISSSSLLSSYDNSSLLPNKADVAAWAHTLRAILRLEDTAGDPSDIGLSEQELCPDPLMTQLIPDGAAFLTGDPGTRFKRAFSPSVTGDIGAGIPRRVKSKGGMETSTSQKCGSVLGPATPVVSGIRLGWESGG